jgi:G3E family GTPase
MFRLAEINYKFKRKSQVEESADSPAALKTKVFLVAGFLGSGKTTLLKRILSWQKDLDKTVVLVNEFGEAGIDGALLGGTDSNVVELTSGCICCTLTADLLRCLSEIQTTFNPRRIIIESSGVADPAAVVSVLSESRLAASMELEKIVTVLDADYWDVRENFGSLFFSQLESADLILLNKIDLVDGDQVPTLLQEIHDEIIGSQVIPTLRCSIDPEMLWSPATVNSVGLQSIQPLRLFNTFNFNEAGQPTWETAHGSDAHATSVAANKFITFSFQKAGSLDERRFKQFVNQLPWELFRMKGSVQFADHLELVNLVGGKSEWSPWEGEPQTRLTFIGWNVDPNQMLEKLEDCLV